MADYASRPAQYRLPKWAHEFLAEESSTQGVSKTEVVLEALECLKAKRFDELMKEGYIECGEFILEEVREWDSTLADGLEEEQW